MKALYFFVGLVTLPFLAAIMIAEMFILVIRKIIVDPIADVGERIWTQTK